jgi:RimJ/RimL family protein N-acetyltransferase
MSAVNTGILFSRTDPALGRFAVRPLDVGTDAEVLHAWVTHPKSAFWMMRDAGLRDVERAYTAIAAAEHHDAFIGLHEGRPAYLVERYDPAEVELKGLYDAQRGDVGMHFLCAPTEAPLHGFTHAVITTVLAFLFEDPANERVVVEPDVHNTAVHALNAAVGFEVVGPVRKPEKEALLSVCTREKFLKSRSVATQGVKQ